MNRQSSFVLPLSLRLHLTLVRDIEIHWDEPGKCDRSSCVCETSSVAIQAQSIGQRKHIRSTCFSRHHWVVATEEELEQYLSDPSQFAVRSTSISSWRDRVCKILGAEVGDLLRVSTKLIGVPSVHKFNRWLEASVEINPTINWRSDFVTGVRQHPQGNFFRSAADTNDATETAAQVF